MGLSAGGNRLSFLSKLPSPEVMSNVVLKELVHFLILKLCDLGCERPTRGKAFITGSEEYARMTRSWQALCLLSRFVTEDIASEVAARVFPAMSFTLHGQIRYFMEVFTIQCTRMHPSIWGEKYIGEIRRNDLSLQQVSSLMISELNMWPPLHFEFSSPPLSLSNSTHQRRFPPPRCLRRQLVET